MTPQPLISIVVPSFNQAAYLAETLQSLVDQQYPALEVVIQDGGSSDGSIAIAEDFVRRCPGTFRLFAEKDAGQADALNRGFARTRGEIMGFLNSDDTLFPGTLRRVAGEIDPSRHRFVVMGRCLFVGEDSHLAGIEHPAIYISHFDHLAIWKRGFNTIPQPSVFWHRSVCERCGGFDVGEQHALDYDLFCRFSRHYHFHRIDELWSTYRMHAASKSSQRTEAEVLELAIRVSRKYWGPWYSPLRWRCELSHWVYELHLHEHARHHARRAEEAFRARRFGTAIAESLKTLMFSPKMARDRLLYAWLGRKGLSVLERVLVRPAPFTGRYADGWIGPLYREQLAVPRGARRVVFLLEHHAQQRHQRVRSELRVNGTLADTGSLSDAGAFRLQGDVSGLNGQSASFEIRTNGYFVPREPGSAPGGRRLSLRLRETNFET